VLSARSSRRLQPHLVMISKASGQTLSRDISQLVPTVPIVVLWLLDNLVATYVSQAGNCITDTVGSEIGDSSD
jgi:hypothetical protein